MAGPSGTRVEPSTSKKSRPPLTSTRTRLTSGARRRSNANYQPRPRASGCVTTVHWAVASRPISRQTFERAAQLGNVVLIMRRKPGDPVGKGEATPAEVDTSALPLGRREGSQEQQYLGPAPLKCDQSLTGVVAEILTFLGPPFGIERVANRPADSPRSQIRRHCSKHKDARLIEGH